jgi:hypothetical protein
VKTNLPEFSATRSLWRRVLPVALLNLVFGASVWFWVFLIPYNKAPDENNHFKYSVKFIIENHRLPVSGKDDVECFRNAASSYNKFPALNYVLAAIAAVAGHHLAGFDWYIGARLMSFLLGLLFINLTLASVYRLGARGMSAVVPVAVVGLIPQVVYVCCYVNADAYALAVSGWMALVMVNALVETAVASDRTPSWKAAYWFGSGVGLALTIKLNYLVYLPWLFLGTLGLFAARRLSGRALWRLAVATVVMSLVLAGGWYLRNYILYGELMPAAPTPEWLASIGVENPPPRFVIATRMSWPALMELVRRGFFTETLGYFYGKFGYGTLGFEPQVYVLLKFLAPASAVLFIAAAWSTRDRYIRWGFLWLAGLAASNLTLLVLYAVLYDYQSQGRYLFPILAPAAVWMGWSCARHPRLWRFALPLLGVNLWLLVKAHFLLHNTYSINGI